MTSIIGNYAGDITEIWYSAAEIDHTEAAIETLLGTAANQIGCVTELGELSAERTNIEFAKAGEDFSSSIPGQASPGSYDFSVAALWDNALHNTLANDNGRTTHTFVIVLRPSGTGAPADGDPVTYIAFDGRIGNATISGGVGEVGTLALSVFRIGGRTIVHNT